MPSLYRRWFGSFRALFLVLPCAATASAAIPGSFPFAPQEDAAPTEQAWPWASTLSSPITLGISSKDRSLLDDDLRRLAKTLGSGAFLPVEMASDEGYDPEAAASERRLSAIVAIDRWDSQAELLAQRAGVDVMFVVTSASARNGKKVKKKYVAVDKTKGDQKPKKIEVTSLLYKFAVDVWAWETSTRSSSNSEDDRDAATWGRVSRIRSEGERSFAPMFLALDTDKFTWDLAAVVGQILRSDLGQARTKLAAQWPASLHSGNLDDLYGTLDELQRAEFWRRALRANPVRMGLSIESLLNLAFKEWARTESSSELGLLHEFARRFVTNWVASARSGWLFKDRPAWLLELFESSNDKAPNDLEHTEALVEELLDNFRSRPPMGIFSRRLPDLFVVSPEDVGFAQFAAVAPDPIRFYRAAFTYSDSDFDAHRKSKSRWLKDFNGVQVQRRYSRGKAILKQSAKSLDPAPVLELVFEQKQHQWPGKAK